MARALECPACGNRTPLDALPDAPTFRCERCGQVLKVPSTVRSAPPRSTPPPKPSPRPAPTPVPPRASTPSRPAQTSTPVTPAAPARAGVAPPPPPRRGGAGGGTGGAAVSSAAAVGAVSATVHPDAPVASVPGSAPADAPARTRRERRNGADATGDGGTAAASAPGRKVRWYWRLLAWIVAVPLGFVITAWPAYHFKWIKKDDLLDVFVGSGNSRYTRLVVLTLAWALVTALLVQCFVEGGRWIAARRRARKKRGGTGTGRGGGERSRGPQVAPATPAAAPTKRPAASAPR